MKFSFFGERCREEDIGIWEEGILNRIYENLMLKNWYFLCLLYNIFFESYGYCKIVNYLCYILSVILYFFDRNFISCMVINIFL